MRCDVLAVGTELLLGQIVDTNSSWLGENLAMHGFDSLSQVKVGDNIGRITGHLRRMLSESDAVIMCGGLGPTHDDLTREAISEVMALNYTSMRMSPTSFDTCFLRNRTMPENNLRQAMVPEGAMIIPQTRGTAPGLICPVVIETESGPVERVVYAVPGVPHEMREMFERVILPDLQQRSGEHWTIESRTLRTWGESESGLNERLDDIIHDLDAEGNPTLAFLASGWEGLKVRLTGRAPDEGAAAALLGPWEEKIREVLGDQVFGVDNDTMESVVLDLLRARGWTLALAESVTGGLVSGRLTGVAGASEVFRGTVVSYASEVKFDVLGVEEGPVVTEEAAIAMAEGARKVLGADVGLALTGVAGPSEQDGMRPGTLLPPSHYCDGEPDRVTSVHVRLPGDREMMRQLSVISALDLLRKRLLDIR